MAARRQWQPKHRFLPEGMTPALAGGLVLASASGYPVGALGVGAASPLLLTAVRLAVAALVMVAIAVAARAHWPRGRLFVHCVVVGLFGHCLHFAGLYAGLAAGVPAAVSALVFGLQPVMTALLTKLWGERLGWSRLLGLVIGVAAVTAALWQRIAAAGRLDVGSLLTVLGLVGLSASVVWQQRFCAGVDIRAGGAIQLAAAVPPLAVLAVLEGGTVRDPVTAGGVLIWLVVMNSVVGTKLILRAVARVGATRTSAVACLVPSVAAVMAWPMLGQLPSLGVLLGIGLGLAACILGTRPAKPPKPAKRAKQPEPAHSRS